MKNFPINLIVFLLFILSIIAIVVFLQVKLSRSKNKFLGLIMPILSFLFSVMTILGMVSFMTLTTSNNGVEPVGPNLEYLSLFFTFLVSNIPTLVLLIIYYSEKNKIKISNSIEKMKISDF